VIAVRRPEGSTADPIHETELREGEELVMLGSAHQLAEFRKTFA
jgi:uncharacterized protein with PhoU and TrkA domain